MALIFKLTERPEEAERWEKFASSFCFGPQGGGTTMTTIKMKYSTNYLQDWR